MSRPHPALFDIAAGRDLGPVVDGSTLVRSAREHRMTGLLWTRERHRQRSDLAPWHEELRREDLLARATARRLGEALQEVVRRLGDIRVEVVTIKGITTEARWYSRHGERPCDDVDVLVGPADISRIDEILHVLQPNHPLGPGLERLVRAGRIAAIPVAVDGVSVDLHFDLLQLGISVRGADRIWERTLLFHVPDGDAVRVLDPETALVHLLLNLNKDHFARLLGYVDIARILQQEELNWEVIDDIVRTEGLETPTYLTLQAVCATLDIPSPPVSVPRGVRPRIWRFLWRPSVRLHGGDEIRTRFRHRQHVLAAIARGRSREALRLWWRLLFPAPRLVSYAYPGESGSWLWRLTVNRVVHVWRRRSGRLMEGTSVDATAGLPQHLGEVPDRAIDASFVPVVAASVASVEVDGEAVLLDEATGSLCLLDPVATLAWSCFDGSTAVGDVAADLAAGFAADADEVLADVVGLARRLADQGMLEL